MGILAIAAFAFSTLPATPPAPAFVQRHVNAGGQELWSIAAGGGELVAVGTGGEILLSPDEGADWSPVSSGVTDWLVGVCYGNGQFVAVGDNGRILVSPDGSTWTAAASSGRSPRLNNVIYAQGVYVAVGEQGTILSSTDGQNWQAEKSGVTGWLRGLDYSAGFGTFFAGGQGGTMLLSADGMNWSPNPSWSPFTISATTNDIEALAPLTDAGGIFVPLFAGVCGQGTALVGEYWPGPELSFEYAAIASGATSYMRGVAGGDGTIYLAGAGGTLLSGPSSGFGPWGAISSGTSSDLNGAAFIGNEVFLVGADETILQSQADPTSRLLNVSTLAGTGSGTDALTTGFVVAGSGPKQTLVRASGPALSMLGVAAPLAQPVLTLFSGAGVIVGNDQGWSTQANETGVAAAAAQVGAFPFALGSADSALLVALTPGVYSAQIIGAGGAVSGNTLLELYDADTGSTASRLVNISSRAGVSEGTPLTAGFVIGGTQPRQVLVRALGPALAQYGISNPLAHPKLAVYSEQNGTIGTEYQSTAASWSGQGIRNANELIVDEAMADAIPLAMGSADQMLVETLAPGAWSVQVTSGDGASGVAVVEVYDLP